jgi:hypothetical protein
VDLQAIRNLIASAGATGTAEEVHAALVAPWSSGTVPVALTMAGLGEVVSPAGMLAIFNHPRFSDLRDDVRGQRRPEVGAWAMFMLAAGLISAEDKDAALDYLASTVPDTRSRAERAGLAGLGVEHVRRAMMED